MFLKRKRVISINSLIEKIKKSYQISNIEFYISKKDGEELLRRTGIDVPEKSHLICPLILDWWNMKNIDFTGLKCVIMEDMGMNQILKNKLKAYHLLHLIKIGQ